jgi:hypothetical protein
LCSHFGIHSKTIASNPSEIQRSEARARSHHFFFPEAPTAWTFANDSIKGGVTSAPGSGGFGPPGGRHSSNVGGHRSPKLKSNWYSMGSTNKVYLSDNPRAREGASVEPAATGSEYYRPRDNSLLVMPLVLLTVAAC